MLRALLFVCALVAGQSTPPAPTGTLTGQVSTGAGPVRYARVVLEPENGEQKTAYSDTSGNFRFDALAPGAYRIGAAKPGFITPVAASAPFAPAPLRVTVSASQTTTFDIRLDRGIEIEGTLLSAQRMRLGSTLTQSVVASRLVAGPNGESRDEPYKAGVADGGRFRLHSLPAGRYVLHVNAGYFGAPEWYYPGRPDRAGAQIFEFVPGQTFTIGEFALPENMPATIASASDAAAASPAIEGRVLDEFGDPLPDVVVQLLERRFIAGRFRLFPRSAPSGSSSATITSATDHLGRFRFDHLPSGEHYLVALSNPFLGSAQPLPRYARPPGLTPTYFPNTDQASDAIAVPVQNGQGSPGIVISMRSAVTGTLAVTRVDAQGERLPITDIVSTPTDILFQSQRGEPQAVVRAKLLDDSDQLPPGRFFSGVDEIYARLRSRGFAELTVLRDLPVGEYILWRDTETIPVSNSPGANAITLRSSPPFPPAPPPSRQIAGRVLAAGAAAPPREDVEIRFEHTDLARILAMEGSGSRTVASFEQGWDFRATPSIGNWPMVIRAKAPAGWALARVTDAGRDITDTPTLFGSVSSLEVILTNGTGSVAGAVVAAGQPTSGHSVIVFAEDRARWTYPSRFVHIGRADRQGQFEIAGLLPGKYLALPLPNNTDEGADPEWLDMMRTSAVPVTISEGVPARITLSVSQ